MRIRTQDRRMLIDITGKPIVVEEYKDGYEIHTGAGTLGIYATEKRALEILDDIQKEYEKFVYKNGIYRKSGCFNMPEK